MPALASNLNAPAIDGLASVGVGVLLAATAILLARETKGLLIGEQASERTVRLIRHEAANYPEVKSVGTIITVQLAPDQVVAAMTAEFQPDLPALELERAIAAIEQNVKQKESSVAALFIKPEVQRS